MEKKKLTIAGIILLCAIIGCNSQESKQEIKNTHTTLFDKSLSEIKQLINGKWELVSNQNEREIGEFENTFITFKDDDYIWTENGESEPGKLNWRKAPTGIGYDAYLMDVFYADYPSFPLAISGDTLYIQDCTATNFKYTLIRKKK